MNRIEAIEMIEASAFNTEDGTYAIEVDDVMEVINTLFVGSEGDD